MIADIIEDEPSGHQAGRTTTSISDSLPKT